MTVGALPQMYVDRDYEVTLKSRGARPAISYTGRFIGYGRTSHGEDAVIVQQHNGQYTRVLIAKDVIDDIQEVQR